MALSTILATLMAFIPGLDVVSAPEPARIKAAADYSALHQGLSMVVLFEGKVVFEQYDNGGAPTKRQLLASGSKSFIGLAAVAAVQDGLIQLDDPVSQVLDEWKSDPVKSKITYRQLLTLTSGLTPGEVGMATRFPSWKELADQPMTGQPGEQYAYGPIPINTVAYAIEKKLGGETVEAYLKRRVLDVIGVKLEWRGRFADRHPQVAGGGWMTARDWATFGEFIRLQGSWEGRSVIDPPVLAQCFQGSEPNPAYGLTWWLKKPVTPAIRRKIPLLSSEWAGVANSEWLPGDLVAACGAGKQRLYVIPSMKLVVVRQGSLARTFKDLEFLSRLLRGKPEAE